jgi:hypothetical protein
LFPSRRVSAKTQEPKNEEYNDHGTNDVDDSIHGPFSYARMGHFRTKTIFGRKQKFVWLL